MSKRYEKPPEVMYRVYTLRNGTKRVIRIEPWRSFQGELKKLNITESDIFQMQMVYEYPKDL